MVDASKAAIAYLAPSGAGAISVTADVDGASIRVGFDPHDAETFWCPPGRARSIAARARPIAGPGPDTDDDEMCASHNIGGDIALQEACRRTGAITMRRVRLSSKYPFERCVLYGRVFSLR
jgi:hypothetical protein